MTDGLNNGVFLDTSSFYFCCNCCFDRSIHLLSRTSSIDKFANIVVDYVVVLDTSWLIIMIAVMENGGS